MSSQLLNDLSSAIDSEIATDLLKSYDEIVTRYRKNDLDGCLSASGKFVENTLRALEFLRTGKVLPEIKNASKTRVALENDTSLPESLRLLVPRVAMSMVYDIRSKTGAVHVKELDPRRIDASLAVHAASWIVAEFIRQFHLSDEAEVESAMASLMRTYTPLIESIAGETVVTHAVPCELEILLLLIDAGSTGLSRTELGRSTQYSPSTVTRNLQALTSKRYVYQTNDGSYHVTGPGEKRSSELLINLNKST
ncbi:MAG: hypothetical protein OER22_00220 [Gammaproteobacteria bacterium]|nr:hypothetical protein [Gammaproteobacteria bacterium]MDH3372093.1 hypothetical protein [Gammaproteobacteria bacterium]MDH3408416.1 hypothetical protein [Gammaproteobacteria bacterium]MDH3551018.1 hypothetical protein [Gammaproteobacteria bacterium]